MIVEDAVYGRQKISDEAATAIIETDAMQRLNGVNQYGVLNLLEPDHFTSRFDHSVGVYLLLQRRGASRREQLAGLIHDVSHTAFSHVIDYVHGRRTDQDIHERYKRRVIEESAIGDILERHGFDPVTVSDEDNFPLLERDIPDLCADRVDYFLRDALLLGHIDEEEASRILDALTVVDGEIMVEDSEVAASMARKFMQVCREFWGSPVQAGAYELMAEVIETALEQGVVTEEDFFLTDDAFLKRLEERGGERIKRKIDTISADRIREGTPDDCTFHSTSKPRYVDPKVTGGDGPTRVSQRSERIAEEIARFRQQYEDGFYITVE